MKAVTINNFSGGLSEDIREQKTNTFSTCKGFNSTTFENRLFPFGETEAESLTSGDITDVQISDIVSDSNGLFVAVGRNSGASPTVFDLFAKASSSNIASTWASFTSLSGAGGYRKNSLTFYKGATYILDTSFNVRKYDGSWTNVGGVDVSATWSTMPVPKPLIHPLNDTLYFFGQQALGKYTTSYSDITLTLPTNLYLTDATHYGNNLLMAMAPINPVSTATSKVIVWDVARATTVPQEIINYGDGSLMILENLTGTVVGVSINDVNYSSTSTYTTAKNKILTVKVLSGNEFIKVKEIDVADTFSLRNLKVQNNGRLYFGGDNDDSLYVIYKNRQGSIVVSKGDYIANGTTVTTLRGFNIIGDYLFTMYDTAGGSGYISRTKVSPSYTNTSTYETNINPSMEINDRTKKKELKAVSVAKSSTTGQLIVKYSVDGSAYTTIGTLSASGSLVLKGTNESDGKPLLSGYEFQFKVESTSGAEPTELKYSYEVIPELI